MSVLQTNSSAEKAEANEHLDLKRESEYQDVISQDILQALKGLQFGEVTITVRDGRIVQIERVIRRRQILSKRTS